MRLVEKYQSTIIIYTYIYIHTYELYKKLGTIGVCNTQSTQCLGSHIRINVIHVCVRCSTAKKVIHM